MSKKILTIVVPTYNVEKYLKRCLDSLLYNEKINNKIEVIVVNDGSKDSSLSIARKYEKTYKDIVKVIDKENGGHGSTINSGLKKASGKFFRVIDSDDWVNIDDFALYVNELEKLNEDMIITNYSREHISTGESIPVTYEKYIDYDKTYMTETFDFDKLKDMYFGMANITYKTEVLRESKLFLDEKTYYVDMEYIILPLLHVKTFRYIKYDIYRYFIGRADQSINSKNYVRHSADHEKVVRRLIEFNKTVPNNKNIKKYIDKILYLLLETHYQIFCKYDGTKEMTKNIKDFDKFLKDNAYQLYLKTNYSYIKANRRTGFIFVNKCRNIFSKLVTKFSGGKR